MNIPFYPGLISSKAAPLRDTLSPSPVSAAFREERAMRDEEHHDDQLIDLGQASVETKGSAGIVTDNQGGKQLQMGLTDD